VSTYVLSVPPSTNACYANFGKARVKTKKYKAWIRGELAALVAQRAKPMLQTATVSITLPLSTRGDCDNRVKPTLDLLVRAGILRDDRSDYVNAVSVSFGAVDMMHVSIEASARG